MDVAPECAHIVRASVPLVLQVREKRVDLPRTPWRHPFRKTRRTDGAMDGRACAANFGRDLM